mmetsp:Transcript_94599/g.291649  ORF Transcript_94599/g.291649 Transcript_94599/m.291649 type:complete len:229 (+) Transcript_94599:567-1253(+)
MTGRRRRHPATGEHLGLLHHNNEDRVGAAADVVGGGLRRRTRSAPVLHERAYLRGASAQPLGEALDEDTTPPVLPDHEVIPVRLEQVGDHLVVDLEVGGPHEEMRLRPSALPDVPEDLLHGARDDAARIARICAAALHGVGLPGTRGPVCQDRRVVTLQRRHHRGAGGLPVDLGLRAALLVDVVEGKKVIGHHLRRAASAVTGVRLRDDLVEAHLRFPRDRHDVLPRG